MGKSYKKAIIKDTRYSDYHKTIRRVNKSIVNTFKTESSSFYPIDGEDSENAENYWEKADLESKIKNPRIIINDYDYHDTIFDMEHNYKDKEQTIKYRRK